MKDLVVYQESSDLASDSNDLLNLGNTRMVVALREMTRGLGL